MISSRAAWTHIWKEIYLNFGAWGSVVVKALCY
jgi:hypothetical protein